MRLALGWGGLIVCFGAAIGTTIAQDGIKMALPGLTIAACGFALAWMNLPKI